MLMPRQTDTSTGSIAELAEKLEAAWHRYGRLQESGSEPVQDEAFLRIRRHELAIIEGQPRDERERSIRLAVAMSCVDARLGWGAEEALRQEIAAFGLDRHVPVPYWMPGKLDWLTR